MSNLQDQLKKSEMVLLGEVEKLIIAELADLVATLPAPYGGIIQGIELAVGPAVKAFIDAKIAALGA